MRLRWGWLLIVSYWLVWATLAWAAPVSTTIRSALVAELPPASVGNTGKIYMVRDASTDSTCVVGGGTFENFCQSTGSAWMVIPVSGSAASGGNAHEINAPRTPTPGTLNAAVAAAGTDVGRIVVDGTLPTTGPVTVLSTSTLTFRGAGQIACTSNVVTIVGQIEAPPGLQIFDDNCAAGSRILFTGNTTLKKVYASWWGTTAKAERIIAALGTQEMTLVVDMVLPRTSGTATFLPTTTLTKEGVGMLDAASATNAFTVLGRIDVPSGQQFFTNANSTNAIYLIGDVLIAANTGYTLIDADGSADQTNVGAQGSLVAGPMRIVVSTDKLCTNSLTVPTKVRIDATTVCSSIDGTRILGADTTGTTVAVVGTSGWTYVDANSSGAYDDGEDVYLTTGVGTASTAEGATVRIIQAADHLCTNSLSNPTSLRVDTDGVCVGADTAYGTILLGDGTGTIPVTNSSNIWSYVDLDGSTTYTLGEPLYLNAPPTATYNAPNTKQSVAYASWWGAAPPVDRLLTAAGVNDVLATGTNTSPMRVVIDTPLAVMGYVGTVTANLAPQATLEFINGGSINFANVAHVLAVHGNIKAPNTRIFYNYNSTAPSVNVNFQGDILLDADGPPILIDADGSSTTGVGTAAALGTGYFKPVKATDKLCTDSLTAPTKVRLYNLTGCSTAGGTPLRADSGAADNTTTTQPVAEEWIYDDVDGDDAYDDGEDLYLDRRGRGTNPPTDTDRPLVQNGSASRRLPLPLMATLKTYVFASPSETNKLCVESGTGTTNPATITLDADGTCATIDGISILGDWAKCVSDQGAGSTACGKTNAPGSFAYYDQNENGQYDGGEPLFIDNQPTAKYLPANSVMPTIEADWWGPAKNRGLTDDLPALAAAISRAGAGQTVHLTNGIYGVPSLSGGVVTNIATVPNGVTVAGDGKYTTLIDLVPSRASIISKSFNGFVCAGSCTIKNLGLLGYQGATTSDASVAIKSNPNTNVDILQGPHTYDSLYIWGWNEGINSFDSGPAVCAVATAYGERDTTMTTVLNSDFVGQRGNASLGIRVHGGDALLRGNRFIDEQVNTGMAINTGMGPGKGIFIRSPSRSVIIDDNYFENIGYAGIQRNDHCQDFVAMTVSIAHNTFRCGQTVNQYGSRIAIDYEQGRAQGAPFGGKAGQPMLGTIADNTIEDCLTGITSGGQVSITGNTMRYGSGTTNGSSGITLKNTDTAVISGNTIWTESSGPKTGISISGCIAADCPAATYNNLGLQHYVITNNNITDQSASISTATASIGIFLTGATNANNLIANNFIAHNIGIQISVSADREKIEGNLIELTGADPVGIKLLSTATDPGTYWLNNNTVTLGAAYSGTPVSINAAVTGVRGSNNFQEAVSVVAGGKTAALIPAPGSASVALTGGSTDTLVVPINTDMVHITNSSGATLKTITVPIGAAGIFSFIADGAVNMTVDGTGNIKTTVAALAQNRMLTLYCDGTNCYGQ